MIHVTVILQISSFAAGPAVCYVFCLAISIYQPSLDISTSHRQVTIKKSTPEYYYHTNLVSRDKIAHNVLIATENSVFYIAKY